MFEVGGGDWLESLGEVVSEFWFKLRQTKIVTIITTASVNKKPTTTMGRLYGGMRWGGFFVFGIIFS